MCIRDRPIVFGEDRLRERGSLPATFYVLKRVFSMANDKSRKFKQNQIMFCMQPWIVEHSRPVVFGEDRLRERGSSVSYTHLDMRFSCGAQLVIQIRKYRNNFTMSWPECISVCSKPGDHRIPEYFVNWEKIYSYIIINTVTDYMTTQTFTIVG